MTNCDVAVIGAGPAGLASAVSAKQNGADKVIIFDRNNWLGGILPQCIHDGFGVEETGSSMTGPEYADMYIKLVGKHNISVMNETMVLGFDNNRVMTAVNKDGLHKIKAKSIILAMGCREKTRWNIMIPGDRPSGIFTAGVAQAFINLYNKIPGKNIIILGSGDVGLIMARRLKFEGANVLGVVEILSYASGLPRNVVQCLDDYDTPLYLNHTITSIEGRGRLECVTIAQVDESKKVIAGSEKKINCDPLLLSLGLIPENEIARNADIQMDEITGGPVVDQDFKTSMPGVFACGNCLQVYDIVDALSADAKKTGENATKKSINKFNRSINVKPGNNIRYVIPQIINHPGKTYFSLRVNTPKKSSKLNVSIDKEIVFSKKLPWVNPANMIFFDFDISSNIFKKGQVLEVFLNEE